MAYRCPGCGSEFKERRGLMYHFEIDKHCAARCQELLQRTLKINMDGLERIYKKRGILCQ